MGLKISANILLAILVLLPAAILFIGIGLLCGSLLTEKQVGGICGALMTNLCAWLSGIWFDVSAVGKWFKAIADVLPFSHAVNAARYAVAGDYSNIMPELIWVIAYAVVISVLAVFVFSRKLKSSNV